MRYAIAVLIIAALSGCGMGRAARSTGEMFDRYGCLAKQLKGEKPCEPAQ